MAVHLFNSSGENIAFIRNAGDKFLFDKAGKWIGWFPWDDDDAVTKEGEYLGTIVGDRLLRRTSRPYRSNPGNPGYAGYAGSPGYPGHVGYKSLPSGFTDVPDRYLRG